MKKIVIFFLALVLLTPSFAFPGMFTFKAGLFIPRAQSDLWDDEFLYMDFTKANYQTTNFGFAYEYFLTRQLSLVIGVDSYNKNKGGSWVDYVGRADLYYDPDLRDWLDFAYPKDYVDYDFIPYHSFNVSITPIQVSFKLTPLGRRGKFIPYIGGGVGLYIWSVRIQGDWIDLNDEWWDLDEDIPIYPIYLSNTRDDNKISTGFHAFLGIMFPVARRITFEVEFKYNQAQGKLEAFQDFLEPFDLSAYQISLGLNYWF